MSAVDRPARMRVASVGVSTAAICGVRDHGTLLTAALQREGYDCSTHWLERDGESLRAGRAQVGEWTRRLPAELAAVHADAVLLHYSVFAYSFRGLPLFIHPVLAAVRRAKVPLVTILHEFVYPWRRDGLRGTAWAVSQRALLIDVMRVSAALVMTTDFQAEWLSSRRWLPKRPVAVAPVFSNLPAPTLPRVNHDGATIGLFGYAYGRATCSLMTGAMRTLQDRGIPARLMLLGAPGQASVAGQEWDAAARAAGLSQMPSFSGTVAPQQLSDELAACDLLLFADPLGPNSRKTTLAASLASGRPVVAVDGPRPFGRLAEAHACEIVTPQAHDVADALARLLEDETARELLGARGLSFAEQNMSATSAAHVVAHVLDLARDRH